ncbi:MFS transporter [Caballeronia sp. LZ065]|uniref:MFS transporter n=1 Tax=Caballeronia sp. LZ065 TaxID=3038571 RepID=UPI0028541C33|nr:MFS transporter [Caballeronia sp. LZ065]MDR5781087.1 MFS transporter [Caballeronia sp. LZ065]
MDVSPDEIIAKIRRHLIPLLMLCYFAAYLDRINLSFAALSMNDDLGLSPSAFGAGAGIFFLGYVVFEVPSNLALRRFGARRWFARIMLTWGIISLLFAFVRTTPQFLSLRLLLGVAEAGFFPGVIFYLTRWFPAAYRGRIIGAFAIAIPASSIVGAPLSGFILSLGRVHGLANWQWLFIIEAIPSLILGVALLKWLVDSPEDATWLNEHERHWLRTTLAAEKHEPSSMSALRNPRVWLLGFVYCGIVCANYGVTFFLPQIVHAFGTSITVTGLLSALPYAAAAIGISLWGARSDRKLERRWHLMIPSIVAILALVLAAVTDYPPVRLAALIAGGFGAFANLPVFWTIPPAMLTREEGPVGIAIISSIGNLAGFFAPYAVGMLKEHTGSFSSGMLALAAFVSLTLLTAAIILRPRVPHEGAAHRATS